MWAGISCPLVSHDELHDSSASTVDSRTNRSWTEMWSHGQVESTVDMEDVVDVG